MRTYQVNCEHVQSRCHPASEGKGQRSACDHKDYVPDGEVDWESYHPDHRNDQQAQADSRQSANEAIQLCF